MKKAFRFITGYAAGIIVFLGFIPVLIYLLSFYLDPVFKIKLIRNITIQLSIATPLLAAGLLFMVWSNTALFLIGKGGPAEGFGIEISPKTQKLVIVGPYKYTRNPMVLGAFLCYFSLSVYLDSVVCMSALLLFLICAAFYLKFSEEKRLLRDFGDEFRQYKAQVPMIIPFIKLGKKGNDGSSM